MTLITAYKQYIFIIEDLGVAKVFPCTDIISLDYPDQIDIHNTLSGS